MDRKSSLFAAGVFLAGSIACAASRAQPPAQPAGATTAPATAPAASESLLNGAITFTPPPSDDGWKREGETRDGKTIAYAIGKQAAMAVNVTPQDAVLDDSAASKLGPFIIKKTRDDVARNGGQVVEAPRNQKDDRFFLHIHDRFTKNGQTADRLQVYRVLGRNLVTVAATVWSDSQDEVKKVHDAAEQVALSATEGGPAAAAAAHHGASGAAAARMRARPKLSTTRPVTLSEARVRVLPPAGWVADLNDQASGLVATFRDPEESGNFVAITVKPLPKEARSDPKLRDAIIDEMLGGETQQFKLEGATVQGTSQTVKDNRFLRKTRTRYEGQGKRFTLTSRQLRIGDALVSVTSMAIDDSAPTVEQLADEVAQGLRPIR